MPLSHWIKIKLRQCYSEKICKNRRQVQFLPLPHCHLSPSLCHLYRLTLVAICLNNAVIAPLCHCNTTISILTMYVPYQHRDTQHGGARRRREEACCVMMKDGSDTATIGEFAYFPFIVLHRNDIFIQCERGSRVSALCTYLISGATLFRKPGDVCVLHLNHCQ